MDCTLARILDANLNRAGEALRVLEEHARMVLNDAELSGRAKSLRHELATCRAKLPEAELLAARDVLGDVGTAITTQREQSRANPAAVASAAAHRATESLRCLEEYGKVVDPAFASGIERIRYVVYTLDQQLTLTGPRQARLRAARLHVLLTESICAGPWLETATAALNGDVDVIQLREKTLPDRELLDRARQLRGLTAERSVLLAINDRPDIARLAGADIVHVGQDDLSVAEARAIAGPTVLVGKSTHSPDQLRAALAEQPDYVAVGPMFASTTKPQSSVRGPALLADALAAGAGPIVAIGGIDAQTVAQLDVRPQVQIAVCQAVIGATEPAEAVRALRAALELRAST